MGVDAIHKPLLDENGIPHFPPTPPRLETQKKDKRKAKRRRKKDERSPEEKQESRSERKKNNSLKELRQVIFNIIDRLNKGVRPLSPDNGKGPDDLDLLELLKWTVNSGLDLTKMPMSGALIWEFLDFSDLASGPSFRSQFSSDGRAMSEVIIVIIAEIKAQMNRFVARGKLRADEDCCFVETNDHFWHLVHSSFRA